MKSQISKKMIFLSFTLITLSTLILLFTMAVPGREDNWEIDEHRITVAQGVSAMSSLVFVGSGDTEYAVAWQDDRGRSRLFEIYFARIDRLGNKIGEDIRLTYSPSNSLCEDPSLVWTGRGYALVYQKHNQGIYFIRLNDQGDRLRNDDGILIDDIIITDDTSAVYPSLVWSGTEYGIAWQANIDAALPHNQNDIFMARLDALGNRIGDVIRVTNDTFDSMYPSLVWSGDGYGIAWHDNRDGNDEIYFSKITIDSEGAVFVGDNIKISNDTITESAGSLYPSLVWTGIEYGLAWHTSNNGMYFARLDSNGNKIEDERFVSDGNYPSLVWTGSKYGIAWDMSEGGRSDIFFANMNADGTSAGDAIRINSETTWISQNPSLVWAGGKYGVAWHYGYFTAFEIYFAEFYKALDGRYPSIYKNKLVYERNEDIYMYDILEDSETQIASGPVRQVYPKIYENIIVWQEEYELPSEEYAFNYFGLLNNCYATAPEGEYDIYMYNIDTRETTRVTDGPENESHPVISGDYIVWAESPPGFPSSNNVTDLGIYKISTGEKWKLSDKLNDPFGILFRPASYTGAWGLYEIAGNLLTFCNDENIRYSPDAGVQFDMFTYVYNLATNTIVDKIDNGIRVNTEIRTDPYALSGERLLYSERVSQETADDGRLIDHYLLRIYSLLDGEVIDTDVEIEGHVRGRNGNCISGNKFINLERDFTEPTDDHKMALKLYNLAEGTNESLVTGLTRHPGSDWDLVQGFDIWGNRLVYSYYSPGSDRTKIKIITLGFNTQSGNDITVDLGNGVSVRYDEVSMRGETILERYPEDSIGGGFEGHFRLATGEIFNISSSADIHGNIDIIINYGVLELTDADARDLDLYHWDETVSPAAWIELIRTAIDEDADTITFSTDSLSSFALVFPNNRPILTPIGNRTVNENATLAFTVSATDPDGDPLTYSVSGLPMGAIFNPDTRKFSWKPTYTQAGVYSVTFSVSDGLLASSETINITVNNVNRPPRLLVARTRYVVAGSELVFYVSAFDPDRDRLTYSAAGLPRGARFDANTRIFRWRPTNVQAGKSYKVRFTVADNGIPILRDSKNIKIIVLRRT